MRRITFQQPVDLSHCGLVRSLSSLCTSCAANCRVGLMPPTRRLPHWSGISTLLVMRTELATFGPLSRRRTHPVPASQRERAPNLPQNQSLLWSISRYAAGVHSVFGGSVISPQGVRSQREFSLLPLFEAR